jgi:hypothetical protein
VVVADVAPGSILWSIGSEYRISSAGSHSSVAFELHHGLAERLRDAAQPNWLSVILDLVPSAAAQYDGPWSRVGLRDESTTYDFSVPTGAHVDAAERLRGAGLTIVRVRMVRTNADNATSLSTCA